MSTRIILSILSVIMFLFTIRQEGRFNKIITGGLMIGLLLTLFGSSVLTTIGFYIYTLCAFLTIIYGFAQTHLSKLEKGIICLTGFIIMYRNIASIMHWPYANETKYLMIIPVLGYILTSVYSRIELKRENGFMTIFAVDCLLKLISNLRIS